MTEFQAQAWICPVCFDDHGGRDCKVDDLKAEIAKLRAEVAKWQSVAAATLEANKVLLKTIRRADREREAAESALAAARADAFSEDAQAVLFGVTGTHSETYGGVTKDEALECAGEVLTRIRAALATPTTTERSESDG